MGCTLAEIDDALLDLDFSCSSYLELYQNEEIPSSVLNFDFLNTKTAVTNTAGSIPTDRATIQPAAMRPSSSSKPEVMRSWELVISRADLALADNKAWAKILRTATPLLSKEDLAEVRFERRRARDRNHAAAGRAARKAAQAGYAAAVPKIQSEIAELQAANAVLKLEVEKARQELAAGKQVSLPTVIQRRNLPPHVLPPLSLELPVDNGAPGEDIGMIPEDLTEESLTSSEIDSLFEQAVYLV